MKNFIDSSTFGTLAQIIDLQQYKAMKNAVDETNDIQIITIRAEVPWHVATELRNKGVRLEDTSGREQRIAGPSNGAGQGVGKAGEGMIGDARPMRFTMKLVEQLHLHRYGCLSVKLYQQFRNGKERVAVLFTFQKGLREEATAAHFDALAIVFRAFAPGQYAWQRWRLYWNRQFRNISFSLHNPVLGQGGVGTMEMKDPREDGWNANYPARKKQPVPVVTDDGPPPRRQMTQQTAQQ